MGTVVGYSVNSQYEVLYVYRLCTYPHVFLFLFFNFILIAYVLWD